jgi:hypothetical protein
MIGPLPLQGVTAPPLLCCVHFNNFSSWILFDLGGVHVNKYSSCWPASVPCPSPGLFLLHLLVISGYTIFPPPVEILPPPGSSNNPLATNFCSAVMSARLIMRAPLPPSTLWGLPPLLSSAVPVSKLPVAHTSVVSLITDLPLPVLLVLPLMII